MFLAITVSCNVTEKGKISKMVSMLNPRKKSVVRYKAVQDKMVKESPSPNHPQHYQRLIDRMSLFSNELIVYDMKYIS